MALDVFHSEQPRDPRVFASTFLRRADRRSRSSGGEFARPSDLAQDGSCPDHIARQRPNGGRRHRSRKGRIMYEKLPCEGAPLELISPRLRDRKPERPWRQWLANRSPGSAPVQRTPGLAEGSSGWPEEAPSRFAMASTHRASNSCRTRASAQKAWGADILGQVLGVDPACAALPVGQPRPRWSFPGPFAVPSNGARAGRTPAYPKRIPRRRPLGEPSSYRLSRPRRRRWGL